MLPFGAIQQTHDDFIIELDEDEYEGDNTWSLDDLRAQCADYNKKIVKSLETIHHLGNGLPPYAWDDYGMIYSPESESGIWLAEVQAEWKRLQFYRQESRDIRRRILILESSNPREHAYIIAREERTVVAGNVKGISKTELAVAFGKIGAIQNMSLDYERNLCTIVYKSPGSANLAQSLHHSRLSGHRITVHLKLRALQDKSSVPPSMCLDAMPFPFTLSVSSGGIGGWSTFFHDRQMVTHDSLADWYLGAKRFGPRVPLYD